MVMMKNRVLSNKIIGLQSQTASLVHNNYDEMGRLASVVTRSDANTTRTTTYTYDKLNRVTRIDYPSPLGYEQFGYNANGSLLWKRDGKAAVTLYKYDELNRLTKV